MNGDESFKQRFRDARKKRMGQRETIATKRKLKPDVNSKTVTSKEPLSQAEIDRILMPPPSSRPQKKAKQAESISPPPDEETTDGVPNDFFEYDMKRQEVESRKSRMQEQTEEEYFRYRQEVEENLERLAEEAAQDEVETQENLIAVEEHEQQERLQLVAELKHRRYQQESKKVPVKQCKTSLHTDDSVDDSDSEQEDEEEEDWRSRTR